MSRKKKKNPPEVSEQQKYRDEVLRLYINCKTLDPIELSKEQQFLVSDISKYWLLKHGCKTIKIQGGESFGFYAIVGIALALIMVLVILYYLPV